MKSRGGQRIKHLSTARVVEVKFLYMDRPYSRRRISVSNEIQQRYNKKGTLTMSG